MKAIKDSAIYLAGELISKSVPFLLLPYLSRKLGVEGFGELSYLQTFIALFAIFIGLSQDGAVARYFYAYGKRSLGLIINTGYIYTLSLTIIILLVAWIVKSEILCYLVLIAASQSFLSVQLSIRQCQKKAVPYTIIQFCSTIFSALLTIAMLEFYSEDLVEKRILAMLLSNFFVSVIAYLFYRNKQKSKKFNIVYYKRALLYIVAFGGPMILHHGSFFIKGQLDRIFIYHKFDAADLGLYAIGVQLASVLSILILAINKALVPYFFEKLKSKIIDLEVLYRWIVYIIFLSPIVPLLILSIPEKFFVFIIGDEFVGVKYYVSIFSYSYFLQLPYLLLVNYFFYLGLTLKIALCSMVSTVSYIVGLLLLMPLGIKYIPYASVISSFIMILVLVFVSRRVN